MIQTAFLGDVILSTCIAENLHVLNKEVEVHYLVKKGNESLLDNHPCIQRIYCFNKSMGKRKEFSRLIPLLKAEGYDEVFNLHRFASSAWIAFRTRARVRVGFQKNPLSFLYTSSVEHEFKADWHEVDRNNKLLEKIYPGRHLVRRPSLYPSEGHLKAVEHLKKEPFVCIAPASVWHTKAMPEKKWVELGKRIPVGTKVYLIGGPQDRELCDQIAGDIGASATSLAGQLKLQESIALMKGAQRVFVNDSGPMHMASSVNVPTTAFFCSTSPQFGFGPLADDRKIIEVKELSCKPCGLHGHKACPKGHFKCGHEIKVDLVQ